MYPAVQHQQFVKQGINKMDKINEEEHVSVQVVKYLKSLEENGSGYIQQLAEHITVESETEHIRDKVFRMWMIIVCAAADYAESTPNKEAMAKFEYMMIFVGDQGIGKTIFCNTLLPKLLREYFSDGCFMGDTDSNCTRYWIVENSVLTVLSEKSGIARFNSFLSCSTDTLRKPYEKTEQSFQRRTVVIGSTNESNFLNDSRGINSRRYWPLNVKKIVQLTDENLIRNAWAEAWAAYTNGEQWWPQIDFQKELLNHTALFTIEKKGKDSRGVFTLYSVVLSCSLLFNISTNYTFS